MRFRAAPAPSGREQSNLRLEHSLGSERSLGVELASSLVSLLGSLLSGSLLASAVVALVSSCDSGSAVGAELFVCGGDGGELVLAGGGSSGKDLTGDLVACGGRSDLVGGRVVDETLLDLALLSGEQDELLLVLVESSDVQAHLLLTG